MNILILSHLYPTLSDPVSGIFVHRQAQALADLGHNVRVVSPRPYIPPIPFLFENRERNPEPPQAIEKTRIKVSFPRYVSPPFLSTQPISAISARIRTTWHINRILRDSPTKPELINAHVPLPDGYVGLKIAEQHDIPLVTTIHGASIYISADMPISRSQIQKVISGSDSVIFNSTSLEREAIDKFSDIKNSYVIPNGVPLDEINKANPADLPTDIVDRDLTIASLGYLQPRKNHSLVLEALSMFPSELRPGYVIIGDGPEYDSLVAQTKELELQDDVRFYTDVENHSEVFSMLKRVDVMVLPSVNEAFGIAFIEAMACGCPVVACKGEGPEMFVTHGETGHLIEPNNSQAVYEALQSYINSEDFLKKSSAEAKRVAETKFAWEKNAEKVESVFQSILSRESDN